MTRLVAILSKQVQLQELIACIRQFNVDDCRLYLFNHQGRISLDDANLLIDEFCLNCRLQITTFDINDRLAIANILSQDADVIAFPLYHSSALYRRVPWLRRRSTVVHITDGFGDLFTMWELRRAVLARTKMAMLKAACALPQLYFCRTDLEFNPFYPEKSPYSKRCLKVDQFPIAEMKRQLLSDLLHQHSPQALIIDGFDLTTERIAAGMSLDSYIATRRDGGIIINGRSYLPNQIICAEEVLNVIRPSVVIGCLSTSLAAARHFYPDLPVFGITTNEASRVRGRQFNEVFKDYGRRFGISFTDVKMIDEQLKSISEQIATRSYGVNITRSERRVTDDLVTGFITSERPQA